MKSTQKIVPAVELLLGVILTIRELYLMSYLPSVHENLNEGLVIFSKYKEDSYVMIFLWSLLIVAGICGLRSEKLKWLANWILLISVSGVVAVPFMLLIFENTILALILGILLTGIIFLVIAISRSVYFRKQNITVRNKLISIFIGIIISVTYWVIIMKLNN